MQNSSRLLLVATAVAVTSLGSAIGAATVRAQDLVQPRERQGYYFTAGYSVFGTQQWERDRPNSLSAGHLLTFRFGEMLSPRWGIGFRLETGSGRGEGRTRDAIGTGLDLQFNPYRNFAIHAGVGVGSISVNDPADLAHPSRSGYGSLYMLGASWDFFVTNRRSGGWALTPTVMMRYLPGDGLSGAWLCAGIQLAAWTGRSRSGLVLPDQEAYGRLNRRTRGEPVVPDRSAAAQ
ncbi:MAG: hypothetical protein ABI560_12050 [Myxococcales bacterium]